MSGLDDLPRHTDALLQAKSVAVVMKKGQMRQARMTMRKSWGLEGKIWGLARAYEPFLNPNLCLQGRMMC